MGVTVREHPAGSGEWCVFVNHHGIRKSYKIGKDKDSAFKAAAEIKARLTCKHSDEYDEQSVPLFREGAIKSDGFPKLLSERKHSNIYPNLY